jgi:hypothetical protein
LLRLLLASATLQDENRGRVRVRLESPQENLRKAARV